MRHILFFGLGLIGLLASCREPFEPEIDPVDLNVLVVEGYLDSEGTPSLLTLNYTQPIQGQGQPNSLVLGADIYLESLGGERFPFIELGDGVYQFQHDISESDSYRLRIFLWDGTSYTSEELQPLITPDIIDVGFEENENGVEIFLTTQGDENADDFLWTYEETWAFRPPFTSLVKYVPETQEIVPRSNEERIDICYMSRRNSDLLLETSSRFQDQFVFRQAIRQIDQGDERLSVRYSILISQKAISKEDSEFWEILKKNTDDLGSIFSPLPSLIGGNIRQDQNPDAPVIGQVSLGVVRQKRMFIDNQEVAPWRPDVEDYFGCVTEPDTVLVANYDQYFRAGGNLPTTPVFLENGFEPIGYRYARASCVDCTRRGTNVKPDFWED
ncbi:DUF4249 domain-containing protein [Algoriphagus kandeliae]|uniref:DUF4249 domain-containing protein n=1 Tax=Algoriphagus kandeliae TaxID=2562278 RepID=A0A4Y9QQU6_9BACT|nr:DUF4249 domain-containing protein [Algoriphagus kandeliae]TFV93363.1 DUF4249 domain-containing protein [Algoriphagus kandeliae]